MTFIQALNNPVTKEIILDIEDTHASLEARDYNDATLVRILEMSIADLAAHGVHYDPRKA